MDQTRNLQFLTCIESLPTVFANYGLNGTFELHQLFEESLHVLLASGGSSRCLGARLRVFGALWPADFPSLVSPPSVHPRGLSAAECVCRQNQPQFAPRAWMALLASLTGKAFHHGRCHPPATGVPSTWGIGSHGPLLPLEAWAASFLGRAVGWQPGCTWETGAGASLCPGGRVNGQDWISLRREKPQAG